MDKCPKCNGTLEWLGGSSAHPNNQYCSNGLGCGWTAWTTEEDEITPEPEQPNFSDFGLFELPIKTLQAFLDSDAEADACMTFTKGEMLDYVASLNPPTEYD